MIRSSGIFQGDQARVAGQRESCVERRAARTTPRGRSRELEWCDRFVAAIQLRFHCCGRDRHPDRPPARRRGPIFRPVGVPDRAVGAGLARRCRVPRRTPGGLQPPGLRRRPTRPSELTTRRGRGCAKKVLQDGREEQQDRHRYDGTLGCRRSWWPCCPLGFAGVTWQS